MQLSPEITQLINDLLVWIGFGTVVGLAARALMPGRDPAGALTTLLLGIGGSVLGCGIAGCFYEAARITPTSLIGMASAVGGAFALLAGYRQLGDLFPWRELLGWPPRGYPRRLLPDRPEGTPESSPRRRQYSSAMYED